MQRAPPPHNHRININAAALLITVVTIEPRSPSLTFSLVFHLLLPVSESPPRLISWYQLIHNIPNSLQAFFTSSIAKNQMSQVLGVLIPGGVVRTDFIPSDASGTKFTLALSGICGSDIASVSELVFFLLPGIQLPQDHGALLYWQIVSTPVSNTMSSTPFSSSMVTTEFELVGAIANHKPSGAFRTGWATNEAIVAAIKSPSSNVTINLGVSIEPMSSIQNMGMIQDKSTHVAMKIAMDLFNYMQSFDTGAGGGGNMLVPKNVFDRWIARFEAKARVDPTFFMKSADDG
jgi:hypothetical protein